MAKNTVCKKNRGRQPKYVTDPRTKKPVVGLSWDDSLKYFYLSHWRGEGYTKRPTFGRRDCDVVEAIKAYQQWSVDNGKPRTILVETPNDPINKIVKGPRVQLSDEPPYATLIEPMETAKFTHIPETILIDAFKRFLKADKARFENQIGYRLMPINPGDDYTLAEVGNCYFSLPRFADEDHMNPNQKMELAEVKKTWQLFRDVIGKCSISEITKADIVKYRDYISEYVKGKNESKKTLSTTTHRKKIEHIKRILNCSLKALDHVEKIQQVKLWCDGQLVPPKKIIKTPAKMIQPDDFQKLLDVSNVEEKALWLISANCAYYSIDLVSVPMSALDLKNKTIVYRRTKTGEHRSAILWNETIKALQDYFETMPHTEGTIFIAKNHHGKLSKFTISDKFIACSIKAGFKKKYIHPNFRDTFETVCKIAGNGIQNSCDCVLGHKQGISSNYIDPETFPAIAKNACEAVRDYYFGK
jgi:hypothetical protein